MDRCSPASPINGMMMERISRVLALGLVLLCVAHVDGYQKYGRSCRDIGCRTDQVCVLAVDPCPLYSSDRDNCGSYPTCVKSNVVARRPVVRTTVRPTPPPRTSTSRWGGRYSGGRFGSTVGNRNSSGFGDNRSRPINRNQPIDNYNGGKNNHVTHTSTDRNVDEYPPVLDIFAENNGGEYKELFRRQDTSVDSASASEPAKTSKAPSSVYSAGSGYPSSSGTSGGSSGYPSNPGYPSGGSSGNYPSGSYGGYPGGSAHSASSNGESAPTRTGSTSVSSGYPTSSGSSPGYPSGSSSGGYPSYPSSDARHSGASGHPSSGSSSSGYPSGSSSGYPSGSSSGGYPAYPSSSGYPARGGSGYPASPQYPSGGSVRYPSSGYPSAGSDDSVRRTSASSVNAGYPSSGGGYPSSGSGGYPSSGAGYPGSGGGGYPGQGQPSMNNYPGQPGGNPAPGGYHGQYGQNNGGQQYPGYNPQPGYQQPGYYDQRYPNGYQPNPGVAYPTQRPKKPSTTDQITQYLKNFAKQALTKAVLDKVSGRT